MIATTCLVSVLKTSLSLIHLHGRLLDTPKQTLLWGKELKNNTPFPHSVAGGEYCREGGSSGIHVRAVCSFTSFHTENALVLISNYRAAKQVERQRPTNS